MTHITHTSHPKPRANPRGVFSNQSESLCTSINKQTRREVKVPLWEPIPHANHSNFVCAYLSVQHHINDFGSWTRRSRTMINCEKCCAIPFTRKNKINVSRLTLGNVYIDYMQERRYLGVHLQRRLNWTQHFEMITQLRPLVPWGSSYRC